MIRKYITNRRIEQVSAFLLSIATLCSAWCAYQSARWNGVQSISLGEANAARTMSSRLANQEMFTRLGDITIAINYMEAVEDANKRKMDFWWRRMRPQVQLAYEAWMKTNPHENPDAPRGPFMMKEYNSEIMAQSEQKAELAAQRMEDARKANHTSDMYVLLTVIFASVLLFGGISTKLQTRGPRFYTIIFGITIWTIAFIGMLTLPIK